MTEDLRRVLVAARGVSSLRVLRTLRDMGVETVTLINDVDAESLWPDAAAYTAHVPEQEGVRWPDPRYVLGRCSDAGCDALHPGATLLARDPVLPRALAQINALFLGATADQLAMAADRYETRDFAIELDIPVVPGSEPIEDVADAEAWIASAGLPCVAKPVDRNSPFRMLRLDDPIRMHETLRQALTWGPITIERMVKGAREIEVPVLADGEGGVLPFGDREVTVHQGRRRLFTECPAPGLLPGVREQMADHTQTLASHLSWLGMMVAVFILTPDGRPYFLQIRPGPQRWDGPTEAVYGVDLTDAQIRLVCGEELGWGAEDLVAKGHAIGMRLYAESDGELDVVSFPEGPGYPVSLGVGDVVRAGEEIASVVVQGSERQPTLVRARKALDEVEISGVEHNKDFLLRLFDVPGMFKRPLDRDEVAALDTAT